MESNEPHSFRFLIVHNNHIALTTGDEAAIGHDEVASGRIPKAFGGFPIDSLHELWREPPEGKPLPEMVRIADSHQAGLIASSAFPLSLVNTIVMVTRLCPVLHPQTHRAATPPSYTRSILRLLPFGEDDEFVTRALCTRVVWARM